MNKNALTDKNNEKTNKKQEKTFKNALDNGRERVYNCER